MTSDNPPAGEVEMSREPHDLKTWPGPFADVKAGRKPFEYRFNDRDYREGDTLRLREWSPETGDYTGENLSRRVGYILHGGQFGIPAGYVIMALSPQPSRPQGEEGLWRPISEAPRDGTTILVWKIPGFRTAPVTAAFWCDEADYLVDADYRSRVARATHWRPLPDPPALSNQGEPSS